MGKYLDFTGLTYLMSKIKTLINAKADKTHTHNYAGSSSAGGAATSALVCTGNSATSTNADMLDGLHSSGFCFSAFTPSTNMNEVTSSGVYRINSGNTNAPSGTDWGQIFVVHGGGDTIAQLMFDFTASRCWLRTGNPTNVGGSGAWANWQQIHTSNTITYGTAALTPGTSSLTTGSIYLQYE